MNNVIKCLISCQNVKEVKDYLVSYFINTSPIKTHPIDPIPKTNILTTHKM